MLATIGSQLNGYKLYILGTLRLFTPAICNRIGTSFGFGCFLIDTGVKCDAEYIALGIGESRRGGKRVSCCRTGGYRKRIFRVRRRSAENQIMRTRSTRGRSGRNNTVGILRAICPIFLLRQLQV
jgi:hypothetical protein